MIYDTMFKQAMIDARLPTEAKQVFEEIKERQREAISDRRCISSRKDRISILRH